MTGIKPKIKSQVNAQLKTRLETMYLYLFESLQSFGVDSYCFETLRKGILERRILKAIYIKYKNEKDIIVGEITIEIDWEKYEIAAKTDYGKSFTFDTNRSLREQLSDITSTIDAHIKKIRETLKVKTIKTSYRYIDEISDDDEKNKEAMNFLGHVSEKKEERRISQDFKNSVEYICDKLSEVKITIRSY